MDRYPKLLELLAIGLPPSGAPFCANATAHPTGALARGKATSLITYLLALVPLRQVFRAAVRSPSAVLQGLESMMKAKVARATQL
jgi:hypothetical protein